LEIRCEISAIAKKLLTKLQSLDKISLKFIKDPAAGYFYVKQVLLWGIVIIMIGC